MAIFILGGISFAGISKKIDIIVKFRRKTPTPGHMTHGPPFNKTEKAGVDRHRGYHNNNTML